MLERPESPRRHNAAGNGKREGFEKLRNWVISRQGFRRIVGLSPRDLTRHTCDGEGKVQTPTFKSGKLIDLGSFQIRVVGESR